MAERVHASCQTPPFLRFYPLGGAGGFPCLNVTSKKRHRGPTGPLARGGGGWQRGYRR